jgi:hypothetical protein
MVKCFVVPLTLDAPRIINRTRCLGDTGLGHGLVLQKGTGSITMTAIPLHQKVQLHNAGISGVSHFFFRDSCSANLSIELTSLVTKPNKLDKAIAVKDKILAQCLLALART